MTIEDEVLLKTINYKFLSSTKPAKYNGVDFGLKISKSSEITYEIFNAPTCTIILMAIKVLSENAFLVRNTMVIVIIILNQDLCERLVFKNLYHTD